MNYEQYLSLFNLIKDSTSEIFFAVITVGVLLTIAIISSRKP